MLAKSGEMLNRGRRVGKEELDRKVVASNHHNANVLVRDANENVISHQRVVSGRWSKAKTCNI